MASYDQIRRATGHTGTTGLSDWEAAHHRTARTQAPPTRRQVPTTRPASALPPRVSRDPHLALRTAAQGFLFALEWVTGYAVASYFTSEIWAGAPWLPGWGGGFKELFGWAILGGLISTLVVTATIWHVRSDEVGDHLMFTGAAAIGLLAATVAGPFILDRLMDGPSPGDWWIGPAFSTLAVSLTAVVIALWKD